MYVLVTKRICEGFFQDVCRYAIKKKIKEVYVVNFTNKNLMAMLSTYARFKESMQCADDVYFLWTNLVKNEFIEHIVSQPSPQILIKDTKKTQYYNYAETLKVTK